MQKNTVILGVIGSDTHIVGLTILDRALKEAGFNVVNLSILNSPEEFIKTAIETDAASIWVSSLCGHAEIDCEGMREKCKEAGLENILLYVGGNLDIGKRPWEETEAIFKSYGFNRVYPIGVSPDVPIADLKKDLEKMPN